MNKFRKMFSHKVTGWAFAAGAALLLTGGTVNGARAALTYYSDDYVARVSMNNIGVTLIENDNKLSWRDYSDKSDGSWDENTGVLALSQAEDNGYVKIGKNYSENLKAMNSGDITSYIRVVIHKYWENPDGSKNQELDPGYILLGGLGSGDGWILDPEASTSERVVLYYREPLPVGAETTLFLTSITADPDLADLATEDRITDGKYTEVTTTFDYDSVKMGLDIEVDAVQEHNISDAAWSAWGRRVEISDGTLSLK